MTQNFKKLLSIVLYLKVWIAILQSTLLTVVLPPAFPATGSFSSVYLHKCVENTFVDLLHHQMSSFPMSTNAGHSFWNDDFQALFLGKFPRCWYALRPVFVDVWAPLKLLIYIKDSFFLDLIIHVHRDLANRKLCNAVHSESVSCANYPYLQVCQYLLTLIDNLFLRFQMRFSIIFRRHSRLHIFELFI